MRILVVFGTRPEAIKLAPVVISLRRDFPEIETRLCCTAQHRELVDQVCSVFDLTPDIDLDLMEHDQTLAGFAARALTGLDEVFDREAPSLVLAQGDTTTVLCAAQTAFYRRIPFGHVEAGLRTGNKWSPFPEEYNRAATSLLADLHFAPTQNAADNLLRAGVRAEAIHITGNPVIDAVRFAAAKVDRPNLPDVPAHALDSPCLLLVTTHRRENFGGPMRNICRAVRELIGRYPAAHAVIPVHPNPAVRDVVESELREFSRVHLIAPPPYSDFIALLRLSKLVLTDSGGVQEEAPALGKPALVLRENTERPEGIEAGTSLLVGTDCDSIVTEASRLLDDPAAYDAMARARNPYGDGTAGAQIARISAQFLSRE